MIGGYQVIIYLATLYKHHIRLGVIVIVAADLMLNQLMNKVTV